MLICRGERNRGWISNGYDQHGTEGVRSLQHRRKTGIVSTGLSFWSHTVLKATSHLKVIKDHVHLFFDCLALSASQLGSFVVVKVDFNICWPPFHKDPLLLLADNFKYALYVFLARKMEPTNEQNLRVNSFFSVLKAIWKKKGTHCELAFPFYPLVVIRLSCPQAGISVDSSHNPKSINTIAERRSVISLAVFLRDPARDGANCRPW